MKGLLSSISTFFGLFKGPSLIFALVAFLAGSSTGLWFGYKAGQVPALKAQQALLEYKGAIDRSALADTQRQIAIRDDVRKSYDTAKESIDALAADLRIIRRDVRLCNAKSAMPLPGPTPGVGQTGPVGQSRPADEVLQELAAYLAERADEQAARQNALIQWVNETSGQQR